VAFAVDLSSLRDRGPSDRARRAAGIGLSTTTLGAALHLAGVALRGLAAGRVPWANMYEFTTVFSLVTVLGFLALARRRDVRYLGALVVGPALLALGLAVTVFFVVADGVQPALQSYWLVIHVAVATISVGVLSLGAAFSVLQLVRMRAARPDGRPAVEEPVAGGGEATPPPRASGTLAQAVAAPLTASRAPVTAPASAWGRLTQALPSADELERLAYRFNAVGFVLWTFTLVAGAIWAEAGRRAATFALVGYACVLLNFFVVNLTFTSLHTYSGL
jgi:ABC-type transport system involved in cytochrome c biogenesis permease subunit